LEAKSRRITFLGESRQKLVRTPFQPIAGYGDTLLSPQASWEAEIEGIAVPGQSGQRKFMRLPTQGEKTGYNNACLLSQLQREA
jgi:hypothetical protein